MTVFFGFQQTFSKTDTTSAGRVITTSTYRMPEKVLLNEQKDTYAPAPLGGGFTGTGFKLSKSDVKTCVWENTVYGPDGPVCQPHELSELTLSYAWVSEGGAAPKWLQVAKTETKFGYDQTGHVALQTTTTWARQATATGFALVPKQMVVKATTDAGTDWVSTTTDAFTWDSRSGTWRTITEASGDRAVGAGKRAGGRRSGGV